MFSRRGLPGDGWLSVGAGVAVLYGVFDEKVAVNNIDPGRGDGRIKLHDEDTAFQANLGLMLSPWKGTRFGLTLPVGGRPRVQG